MLSQKRINDFQGTDSEYIVYLESIVLSRQVIPIPSPPSPRSDVRDEAIDNSDGDEPSASSIRFIPYEPEIKEDSLRPAKKQRTQPRWEREMDEMLPASLSLQDWSSKRKTVGLSSSAKILGAFDMIIGTAPRTQPTITEGDHSVAGYDSSNSILQLLDAFANTTAVLGIEQIFTTQVYNFRVFVFVSLCCVALHHNVDPRVVDDIMQKCISDSDWRNLARLRSGARWANRMMNTLAEDGLGHLAYEIFVLWGRPVAHYGRFADAGNNGFSYFRSRVPQCEPALEIQGSLPFWPPFIIKTIVGEVYSLSAICAALTCDRDPLIHDYPRYEENYLNRQMPLPQPTITEAGKSLEESTQANGYSGPQSSRGEVAPAPALASDGNLNSILALLTAAKYSDQQMFSAESSTVEDGMANHIGTPLDLNLYAGVNSSPQRAAEELEAENRLHTWEGLDLENALDMWEGVDVENALDMWEGLDLEIPLDMWEGLESERPDILGNGGDVSAQA